MGWDGEGKGKDWNEGKRGMGGGGGGWQEVGKYSCVPARIHIHVARRDPGLYPRPRAGGRHWVAGPAPYHRETGPLLRSRAVRAGSLPRAAACDAALDLDRRGGRCGLGRSTPAVVLNQHDVIRTWSSRPFSSFQSSPARARRSPRRPGTAERRAVA